jgi:hypothetical protein
MVSMPPSTATEQPALRAAFAALRSGGIHETRIHHRHEPSFWLRCRLADLDTRALSGRLGACPHANAAPFGILALWAPDTVWCASCSVTAVAVDGDADRTCDRCGRVDDRITGLVVTAGRLLIAAGLCRPCRAREER